MTANDQQSVPARLYGWVMLATYNEAANIAFVLDEVQQASERLTGRGIDLGILLIDDASPDGTARLAVEAAAAHGLPIRVVSGAKAGLGAAYIRGLRAATEPGSGPVADGRAADFIVTLDADRQHDARQMPGLIDAFLATGAGVLIGSRWTPGGRSPGTSPARTALSRAGNLAFRVITGTRGVRDATTSYRVIDPAVARRFDEAGLEVTGYAFFSSFIAIAQAAGAIVAESPITFRPRGGGQSKLTAGDGVEFARNLFRIRRTVREITAHRAGLVAAAGSARPAPWVARDGDRWAPTFGAAAELAYLGRAHRFVEWVVDEMEHDLGRSILHIGAGIGTFTAEIRRRRPTADIVAMEASPGLTRSLEGAARTHHFSVVRTDPATFLAEQASRAPSAGHAGFDTVVITNVLEQLDDDVALLRIARELLRPGGAVVVLVPATPEAYGTMDHLSGHHRRYTPSTLQQALSSAGLEVGRTTPLDGLGLAVYRLAYRVLRISTLRRPQVSLYDQVVVPVSRVLERGGRVPRRGKNLVASARRPPGPPG